MSIRWEDNAACRDADPELFFPQAESGVMPKVQLKTARGWCTGCTVRADCLSYALGNPEKAPWGIWGGLTPRERERYAGLREAS